MKKYLKHLILIIVCIFSYLISSNYVFSYELNYMGEVENNYGGTNSASFSYYTFVKAADGAKGHSSPYSLNDKFGSNSTYQTHRLLFHSQAGSNYQGYNGDFSSGGMIVKYDVSKENTWMTYRNISNGDPYNNYKASLGSSKVVNIAGTQDDKQILWPDSDDPNIAEDSVEVKGDLEISKFKIARDTYTNLIEKLKDGENSYYREDLNGYVIMVSNQLNTLGQTFNTAYDFYKKLKENPINGGGWNAKNYGIGELGQSALNNYDNNLLVPSSMIKKQINIRIKKVKSNGTYEFVTQERLKISRETIAYNGQYNSEKYKLYDPDGNQSIDSNYYRVLNWTYLNESDSIFISPDRIIDLSDNESIESVAYEKASSGYSSTLGTVNNDKSVWISGNDKENIFYITYTIVENDIITNKNIFNISHIDIETGELIEQLAGTERIQNGIYQEFAENEIIQIESNNNNIPQRTYYANVSNNTTIRLEWSALFFDGENFDSEKVVNIDGKYYMALYIYNKTNNNAINNFNVLESTPTVDIYYYYRQVYKRELYINNINLADNKLVKTEKGNRIGEETYISSFIESSKILTSNYQYAVYYTEYDYGGKIYALDEGELSGELKKLKYQYATYYTMSAADAYTLGWPVMSNLQAAETFLELQGNITTESSIDLEWKSKTNDATVINFYYADTNTISKLKIHQLINSSNDESKFENGGYIKEKNFNYIPFYALNNISGTNSPFEYNVFFKDVNISLNSNSINYQGKDYICYGYTTDDPSKNVTNKLKTINLANDNIMKKSKGKEEGNIYYLYKEANVDNTVTPLIGWFDFVNEEEQFQNSTLLESEESTEYSQKYEKDDYKNMTLSDTGSQNYMDKIPSTSKLAPYVAGAYPYIINGLKYEKCKYQTSLSIQIDYYYNYR